MRPFFAFSMLTTGNLAFPLGQAMHSLRLVLLCFLVLPTVGCAAPPSSRPAPAPPNVIFILADDMGYADIAPFGAQDIRTPALDRLAREGVKLTDNYSNGPVCTPTRAAFITGRYQQRVGLEWAILPAQRDAGLHAGAPSLARALKARRYATALVGKWHLGTKPEFAPNAHGFDEFFGILGGNADMYSHQNAIGEHVFFENDKPAVRTGYLTDLFNERALEFVEKHRAAPFFLYLAYNAAHWPFQPPDDPKQVRTKETWYDGSRQDYAAMIERMDRGIGQLLDALDRLGLAKDTLVIFTHDNGGERLSRNDPLRDKKGTLWEGGIRVPALARWPGKFAAHATCNLPVMTMDWTASILNAAGAHPSAPLDGIDLLPWLQKPDTPPPTRTLFWRKNRPDFTQKAARQGRWKYLLDGTTEHLFDLSADAAESHDVAAQHPRIVRELRAAVQAWEQDVDRVPPPLRVL
ncbi:MAG: sulfatase-like hydrolase/transferase [Opitutaceae bacterium]